MTISEEKYTCKYCEKSFRKESTLIIHMCEKKRRWKQENETGVRLGFGSYLQFYTETQGSSKTKTYSDFVDSPYYSAFVKYGQYLIQIRAINIPTFTSWLLKGNKKLDSWVAEKNYDEYLYEYLRKEHPNDALDRSFAEMQKWADDTGKNFNTIFREGAPNKVCNMIVNGRLSPWVIYASSSGILFLDNLNEEQVTLIFKWIDPEFWQRKFKDYVADTEFIKQVCLEANL